MTFWERLINGVSNEFINKFSAIIPQAMFALLILVVGWIIASTFRKIIRRIFAGLGIDRMTEQLNDIEFVQNSGMRIELSKVLSNIVYYVMMLFFIVIATDMLGVEAITTMVRDLINYLPSLLTAFVFLLLGVFLADMIRGVVETALRSLGLPSAKMIASGVFYFLFITIAVSALAQAKINTGFIAANMTVLIGALALAFAVGYGLAAKDLVSNYLAGFYNKNKIRVGDEIRIIGVKGKVVMIDSSSLILQTEDRAIVVPLSKLTTEKVEVFYPDPSDDPALMPGEPIQRESLHNNPHQT
jgi:small-conductance mechanosensitive channel